MSSILLYIDPAATSVLISSLTAIVVAIAATVIVLWRKFKKGVTKTLHIDPNAHKEVEEDLIVNENKPEEQKTQTEETEKTNAKKSK